MNARDDEHPSAVAPRAAAAGDLGGADAGEVLVYALGGGLGHLARARRVVHALGVADRAVLLTSSPHADDPRVTGGLRVARVDPALERDPEEVCAVIAARAPATLIVDAFPLGILGELEGIGHDGGPRIVHVARRMRWDAYRGRVGRGRIRFARTLVLEPLEDEHHAFLRARSDEVVPLALPAAALPSRRAIPGPHWLVVHGGPDDETLELVEHAREHQRAEGVAVPIVVLSPSRPRGLGADVACLDEHPAAPFFAAADRLLTAAGWNVMDETRDLPVRHHVVPFERALDDQPWRAARRRVAD